jgi:hypothetical protein
LKNNSISYSDSLVLIDQAAGQKQIAILEAMKLRYEKRIIIAGTLNERDLKLDKSVIWEKNICYNRFNLFLRIISWFRFSFKTFWIIKRKYPNADLFIVSNPPLNLFVTLFLKNKFDVLVFDLYPDALTEYNYISKNSILYSWWERRNIKIFKEARRIFTLSDGMVNKLSKYTSKEKIEIVPLWTDTSFLKPIQKINNPFVADQNLKDKFVVMYSGNMGLTHPVELILDLAMQMRDCSDVYFLLIGGGHKFKMIQNKINSLSLENIRILPWQESKVLPYSMNSADLGVVTLDEIASELSVPSKIFDLFSIGVPVLGVGSTESELSKLLLNYDCGICFNKQQITEMEHYILKLKNESNYYKLISKNSLYASTFHTPSNANKFL